MATITNVFLDFDNTQFDGHLHNILTNYLGSYKDNQVGNLTNDRLRKELTGELPLSKEAQSAISEALEFSKGNPRYGKGTLDFFNAENLNTMIGELKQSGANVMVLTASSFPNAIKGMYEMKGLTNLQDLTIYNVSFGSSQQMAQYKNLKMHEVENDLREKGRYDTVVNFFVDDSKTNIEEFKNDKSRDKSLNFGIHANDGLTVAILKFLNSGVKAQMVLHNPKEEFLDPKKGKHDKYSKDYLKENKKFNHGLMDLETVTQQPKESFLSKIERGIENLFKKKTKEQSKSSEDLLSATGKAESKSVFTEATREKSKSSEDLLAATGKAASKSVFTEATREKSKSSEDLLSATGKAASKSIFTEASREKSKSSEGLLYKDIKANEYNRESDIFGKISNDGLLTTSKNKVREVEKVGAEATHNVANKNDFSKFTIPINKNQEIAKPSAVSSATQAQNQSLAVDKTQGAIPKKVGPQVAMKPPKR